jgi:putative N6-adenine-specific DNA methylase
MTIASALEKRIRRHVIGPAHPFFAVTAPGLEAICAMELAAQWPDVEPRPVVGGVSFKARLDQGMLANLTLRTAGRVLMRMARFPAAHFAQLEKAFKDLAWELYLAHDTPLAVRVSARKSRLHHSEAIAERLMAAVEARRRAVAFAPGPETGETAPQIVLVRADHDRFTVSLDASGDLLHKRGLKTNVGPAPIRETLAAAILRHVGYTGAEPLLDPMGGSGTFSLEAAMLACRIPPGWYRDFAFQRWPAFRPKRWAYLRRACEAAIRRTPPAPIWSFDRDPAACNRVEAALQRGALRQAVAVESRDFFDIDPRTLSPTPGVAVINPPYGRRMGSAAESRALFARISDQLVRCYGGWKVGLIAPPGAEPLGPPGLAPTPLLHGGLRLVLLSGTLPS